VRVSEFWQAVADEFGDAYGRAVTRDLVLGALGDRTPAQAIASGIDPRAVWAALCSASDVPEDRRYGVGQLPGK